jgi:processive 1,2-diacylglycerol beta-glucosyltransferase
MSFAEKINKQEIAAKLGLSPVIPTVLIMGGGQGLGPIKKVVKSLLKLNRKLQLIVIAGTNAKLMDWLEKTRQKTDKALVIYDYANNVPELMDLATLIISKPGGMTTSECLAKGLPMVIVNPIPGQEMHNTSFLIKKGIAIRIDDVKEIAAEVNALLDSPQRLAAMSKAAKEQGKPYAARDVAQLVLASPPKVAALV